MKEPKLPDLIKHHDTEYYISCSASIERETVEFAYVVGCQQKGQLCIVTSETMFFSIEFRSKIPEFISELKEFYKAKVSYWGDSSLYTDMDWTKELKNLSELKGLPIEYFYNEICGSFGSMVPMGKPVAILYYCGSCGKPITANDFHDKMISQDGDEYDICKYCYMIEYEKRGVKVNVNSFTKLS